MKLFSGILTVIIGAIIGALATAYIASGTTLEFREHVTDSYFVVPDQIKSDLKIEHKGKTIPNISVVEIAIFNRSWWSDVPDVTLYFRIKAQTDKPLPLLISKDLTGPKRLGKIGISENRTEERGFVSYSLKNLKRSKDNDYYLASFIFEGSQPPEISVTTNDKNVDIEPYSERRDVVIAVFTVLAFYSILIAFILFFSKRSEKKARAKLRTEFKQSLLEKKPEITSEDADAIIEVYEGVIEAGRGKLARFIYQVFSKHDSQRGRMG